MQEVRFGIIGVGIQGSKYLGFFVNHELKNGRLVAICDRDPKVPVSYTHLADQFRRIQIRVRTPADFTSEIALILLLVEYL